MRRAAVTTAADTFDRVAAPLRRHGLHPVPVPCVRVAPSPPETLSSLRAAAPQADWILVTSARAVALTWPGGDMPPIPVAAVGPATAEAVAAAGGRPAIVGEGGAVSLVDTLAPVVAGRVVVFPRARDADPATEERLVDAGASVVSAPVYTTVPVAASDVAVDAVVFGSPSAVAGWCLSRGLNGVVVAAMGSTTAAALDSRGRSPDVIAARPGFAHVAAALAEHFADLHVSERNPV